MSFKEATFERDGRILHANLLRLENAILVFFYEGEMKMGTLAFALPGVGEMKASTSSILLGGKNLMLSRALAERVAASFNKMSLVSVYTDLPEAECFRVFVKLLEDLIAKKG